MAFQGTFTNTSLDLMRIISDFYGYKISMTRFACSTDATPGGVPAMAALTSPNAGTFYTGNVTAATLIGNATVQVTAIIPPGAPVPSDPTTIEEMYILAEDADNQEFLLAVAQPAVAGSVIYSPGGETQLRLQIALSNADLTSFLQFNYTQAVELEAHNEDAVAHPDIRANMEKAGIFEQPAQRVFKGQSFDEYATFVGAADGDIVYRDTDDNYKPAIANGTTAAHVAGVANVTDGSVASNGIVEVLGHGFSPLTPLYLSALTPGQLTDVNTGMPVGYAYDTNNIYLRINFEEQVSEYVDTVVSDEPGLNHYVDAQAAIDATPAGGWVRFDKLVEIEGSSPLTTGGKVVNFKFTGYNSGLRKFEGLNEIQLLEFSSVPDAGDFLLIHAGLPTNRIPYTATAGDVQTELLALASIDSCVVSGTFATGFTVEFTGSDGLQPMAPITFGTELGVNEEQRLAFDSDDFNAGSFQMRFNGNDSGVIFANEIDAAKIETELEGITGLTSVTVIDDPGAPAGTKEFTVEFTGVDGLQPQPTIQIINNSLTTSAPAPITITPIVDIPGELPDNLLTDGGGAVIGSESVTQGGLVPGTGTGLELDADTCQIIGLGRLENFTIAIDLNGSVQTRIEMNFVNNTTPIETTGLALGDYNTSGSLGLENLNDEGTSFRELVKVTAETPASFVTQVSAASIALSDGSSHGLVIDQRVSGFAGGEINWETGVVTGGLDFTPYTASQPNHFFKYAVMLMVDDTLKILPPPGDHASANLAPVPKISGGLLRAIVTVQDNGSGGIEAVDAASITRFFHDGLFHKEDYLFSETGNNSSSQVTVSNFTFDPDNAVNDIDVIINGERIFQDSNYHLTFQKIDGQTIEILMNASPFVIPDGAVVDILYRKFDQSNPSGSGQQATFNVTQFTGDNSTSNYVLPAQFNLNTTPGVYDVEVLVGGIETAQEDTSVPYHFVKVANNEIEFRDANSDPYLVPAGARILVKSRNFVLGAGQAQPTLAVSDEGSTFTNPAGSLDFAGDTVELTEESNNEFKLTVTPQEVTNVGATGEDLAKGRNGINLEMFKLDVGPGLSIQRVGDVVFINLSQSGYFVAHIDNVVGSLVNVGGSYDQGTRKMMPWRNGLRMINTAVTGEPADRYSEPNTTQIQLALASVTATDHFDFINEDAAPIGQLIPFTSPAVGLNKTTITVPTHVQGNGTLRVYRNGYFMNEEGIGELANRFTDTSVTTIELDLALEAGDWLYVEVMAVTPAFIPEVLNGQAGTTITFAESFPGSDLTQIFRNGLLMNVDGFGDPDLHYTISGSNEITLNALAPADTTDVFTLLVKS
jgi:hypothetical protein